MFAKRSILDVGQDSEYAAGYCINSINSYVTPRFVLATEKRLERPSDFLITYFVDI